MRGRRPAPLFLLADSQLLFWGDKGGRFVDRIAAYTGPGAPRAAYLGASNGDDPEFYSIFLAAIEAIGPAECRMIPATPSEEERAFVESGGRDPAGRGRRGRGLARVRGERGSAPSSSGATGTGAVLMGVSAGAVQLGTAGWPRGRSGHRVRHLGVRAVRGGGARRGRGMGQPAHRGPRPVRGGAGHGHSVRRRAAVPRDGTLEAVRHTLAEFTLHDGAVTSAVIFPPRKTRRRHAFGARRGSAGRASRGGRGAENERTRRSPSPASSFSLLHVPRPCRSRLVPILHDRSTAEFYGRPARRPSLET